MTDAYGNDAATSTGTIADTTNNAASGAPQRAESTERLARPLIKLAKACGLATSFINQLGTYTEISDAAWSPCSRPSTWTHPAARPSYAP